ncbi:MAG: LPXTG cell wall anchor domain-containing protein [Dactylosporangium sp.]|nr:LPXTG cell wall anchor domain-containing protein [Dactylosporangium sp.]NNJ60066.1 LPXTG cell wall anchor domain-containing protein [Dactylosporangium sp.]
MRSFLPSPRRVRNIVGAGAVGVAAALTFATPALACHPVADKPSIVCDDRGGAEITWTIKMDSNVTATVQGVTLTPEGSTLKNGKIAKGKTFGKQGVTDVQVVPPGTTKATMKVKVEYQYNGRKQTHELNASTEEFNCPVPSESPTPSESPAPSESAVASASSSGGSALPVTGANTAIIAGVAVLLVGAGAGLFLVARRRQVRFTA